MKYLISLLFVFSLSVEAADICYKDTECIIKVKIVDDTFPGVPNTDVTSVTLCKWDLEKGTRNNCDSSLPTVLTTTCDITHTAVTLCWGGATYQTEMPGSYDLVIPATNGAGEISTATAGIYSITLQGNANARQVDIQMEVKTVTASGASSNLLQTTTIATLASQTSFTLTAGSADDSAYNSNIVIITDSATSTQKAVGRVKSYTGSTKTVVLETDPAIFTMATGDTIDIIATELTWDATQGDNRTSDTMGRKQTQ